MLPLTLEDEVCWTSRPLSLLSVCIRQTRSHSIVPMVDRTSVCCPLSLADQDDEAWEEDNELDQNADSAAQDGNDRCGCLSGFPQVVSPLPLHRA